MGQSSRSSGASAATRAPMAPDVTAWFYARCAWQQVPRTWDARVCLPCRPSHGSAPDRCQVNPKYGMVIQICAATGAPQFPSHLRNSLSGIAGAGLPVPTCHLPEAAADCYAVYGDSWPPLSSMWCQRSAHRNFLLSATGASCRQSGRSFGIMVLSMPKSK